MLQGTRLRRVKKESEVFYMSILTRPLNELSEGEFNVAMFELWQDGAISGKLPDAKRFEKEFFEYYGDTVASPQAPFYLMFCAFVGALDLADALRKDLDQEDTETAK